MVNFSALVRLCVLLFCALAFAAYAGIDLNPASAGATQARNAGGSAIEGSLDNPALLGTDRAALGCFRLAPLSEFAAGASSDKLALNPFYALGLDLSSEKGQSQYLSRVFRHSAFIRADASPEEASRRLTKKFKGGAGFYSGGALTLASITGNRMALSVHSRFDEDFHVPEGALLAVVSTSQGMQRGNTLDFSNLRQDAIWATDITFSVGLPVTIPVLHEFFHLPYGAGGVGVKYVIGHSAMRVRSKDGSYLTYNGDDNILDFDGEITVQTAGEGYSGGWRSLTVGNPFKQGFPVAGQGVGFDIGGVLFDADRSLSINFHDLGVVVWYKDVKEVAYGFHKDSLSLYDLFRAQGLWGSSYSDSLFDRNKGNWYPRTSDTLETTNGFVTFLPMSANIGYTRSFDISKRTRADRFTLAAHYDQSLAPAPGRSFIPRLSLGCEAGLSGGRVPLRAGWIVGGTERVASALGLGFRSKGGFAIDWAFKAFGTPVFWPRRGFETALGLGYNWGLQSDRDRDSIFDKLDRCPDIKEDRDGFEDADGCPEYDNDHDSIPDTGDRCMNIPEDRDGYEDLDGCPDNDNDGDGVRDTLDKCIMVAEDHDWFEDADGCPDSDNDLDGVPDSLDGCPNIPEDRDGYKDGDGCPDGDNDFDGKPDSSDACPDAAENYNCFRDVDGCPDTLAVAPIAAPKAVSTVPTARELAVLNTKLRGINFASGSAQLTPDSYGSLNYVAGFLKQYPTLRYEIQGHTDSQGDDNLNLLLSRDRVRTVRNYLLSQGCAENRLVSIGYGESRPLDDNNTAAGRAQNRRVEFVSIESDGAFADLQNRAKLQAEMTGN